MKKKLFALVCAVALSISLIGCSLFTPSTVGRIGDYEVTAGMYRLAQFGAYQQAAQLAGEDQDTTDVAAFLQQTITVDDQTGTTALVSDYVAAQTEQTLRSYAAVDSLFREVGGELSDAHLSLAENYADQLMELYGDVYTANGIDAKTLKQFQCLQLENALLLDLCYGENGAEPVSDEELTAHLYSRMYEIAYIVIPLYNDSTTASASQVTRMLELAQAAVDTYNQSIPADAAGQVSLFGSYANTSLVYIFAAMSSEVDANSTLQRDLLGESDLASAFTKEGSADILRTLDYGEAAAFQYSDYAMMMAVRLDPLEASTLSEIRSSILADLMGDTLTERLNTLGAALESSLDVSAMEKLPASKIVLS